MLHTTGGGLGCLVIPFPPRGPASFGLFCLPGLCSFVPCFFFLSLSWVLSFFIKGWQGFINT